MALSAGFTFEGLKIKFWYPEGVTSKFFTFAHILELLKARLRRKLQKNT